MAAGAFCIVVRSTDRSGFISVAIGFMNPGDAQVLPVGDAALRGRRRCWWGAPGRSAPPRRRQDFVVHTRAGAQRDLRSDADADRLDRVDAEQRLPQPAVELAIPLHVRAEPHRARRSR
jgi:hypothetical protein